MPEFLLLPHNLTRALLEIQFWVTCVLTGLAWLMQLVVYPIVKRRLAVGAAPKLAQQRRVLGFIVAPFMVVELLLAGLILLQVCLSFSEIYSPTPMLAASLIQANFAGFLLVLLIWHWTFFRVAPIQDELQEAHEEANRSDLMNALMRENGWRTVFWTLRVALLFWLLRG